MFMLFPDTDSVNGSRVNASFMFPMHIDTVDKSRGRLNTPALDVTKLALQVPTVPKNACQISSSPTKVVLALHSHRFALPMSLLSPDTPFAHPQPGVNMEDSWTVAINLQLPH